MALTAAAEKACWSVAFCRLRYRARRMLVASRAWLIVPSTPVRRVYLACQVSFLWTVRAAVTASCSSWGRRVSVRVPRAAVVHVVREGQARQSERELDDDRVVAVLLDREPACAGSAFGAAGLAGVPVDAEGCLVEALGGLGLRGVVGQQRGDHLDAVARGGLHLPFGQPLRTGR